ncbi:MAG: hypothetical protein H0W88_06360 [Parachlamydiaceae bacterium]|nr:hypothetical protein [Parachlamydiaceae bacterium]
MASVSNQNPSQNISLAIQTEWGAITNLQKNVLVVAFSIFVVLAWAKTLYYICKIVRSGETSSEVKTNETFKKILQAPISELNENPLKHIQAEPEASKNIKVDMLEASSIQDIGKTVVKAKDVVTEPKPVPKNELQEQIPERDIPKKEAPKVEVLKTETKKKKKIKQKKLKEPPVHVLGETIVKNKDQITKPKAAPKNELQVQSPKLDISKKQATQVEVPKKEIPKTEIPQGIAPKAKVTVLDDGTEVEGELVNYQLQGQGKIKFPNGLFSEGMFKNGLLHGIGRSTNYGFLHEGSFVGGVLHGRGKKTNINAPFLYQEGMFIKGELIDGVSNTYNAGYNGMFLNGMLTGKGSKTLPNGDIYEGNFRRNKLFGSGKIIKKDKTVIEGVFKDDEQVENGYNASKGTKEGVCVSASEKAILEGLFSINSFIEGTWTLPCGIIYIGHFNALGRMYGEGLCMRKGVRLEGMFIDDDLNGKGRVIFENGDLLEGDFHYDTRINGKGKYTTLAGEVFLVTEVKIHQAAPIV